MEKDDMLRIAEKVIETIPELITAIVAYLTYKELKKAILNTPSKRNRTALGLRGRHPLLSLLYLE